MENSSKIENMEWDDVQRAWIEGIKKIYVKYKDKFLFSERRIFEKWINGESFEDIVKADQFDMDIVRAKHSEIVDRLIKYNKEDKDDK